LLHRVVFSVVFLVVFLVLLSFSSILIHFDLRRLFSPVQGNVPCRMQGVSPVQDSVKSAAALRRSLSGTGTGTGIGQRHEAHMRIGHRLTRIYKISGKFGRGDAICAVAQRVIAILWRQPLEKLIASR
jgi:hypothetical protein